MNIEPAKSDYFVLADFLNRRPTKSRKLTIPEFAETTIVPAGKYRGMPHKNNRAPYIIEPMLLMSPQSNMQEIFLMWPAQVGKTFISEIITQYYIIEYPSEILYVSSNENSARKWMERRIEPRAAAAGIEFRAQTENKKSRRSGDLTYSKEFDGGNVDVASSQSSAQLASETKRVVLADEVDRWKLTLGVEGYTWDIMHARSQAWGDQRKIMGFSTPTTEQESLINKLYLGKGDQRLYYVPCPHCGTMQILDIVNDSWGLKWEIVHGRISKKSLVYVCSSKTCQREIRETKKPGMMIDGHWQRTGKSISEYTASFHINGLYSPFLSWHEMAQSAQDAEEDPRREQAFKNLKMGSPYKLKGSRPETKRVKENRGTYKSGSVPWGVLYITAGVDVQRGSEKYKDMSDFKLENEINEAKTNRKFEPFPRVEIGFLGIGAGYRTWGIDYKVFNGHVTDPFSGAWEKLFQWCVKNKLTFERKEDARIFPVSLIFADSNDWYSSEATIRFCSRITNTFPCKGMGELKRRKNEKPDEVAERDFIRYRPVRVGDGKVYEIYTNYYKKQIYHNLKIPRKSEGEQFPGFCDFPANYGDRYFDGLTAEEYLEDGSFYAGSRRNEPLDIFVYSLCAGDAFLDSEVEKHRQIALEDGKSKGEANLISGRDVLQAMKKGILGPIRKKK